jgi:uncharacterized protein (TIGR00369 family)
VSVDLRQRLGGLEFFRLMLAGEVPHPPMLELMGIRIVEAESGRVVFRANVDERYNNGTGVAHGGFAATLLDTALGCAINSTTPAGRRFTTVELKVNLTRPLTGAANPLTCEGKVIHIGGRIALSEAWIHGGDGKLYAHGTTTCIVVEPPRGTLEP